MVIWAGTSTQDVGMVVEHYPSIVFPSKKQEIQSVPGRNGDIILYQNAFENYDQTYQVFINAKSRGGLKKAIPQISDWLMGHSGYQRLEDGYFPEIWRRAYYSGGSEFLSILNEYGEGTLKFTCAPEKYYKTGDRPITLTNGQIVTNPTMFHAQPLIRIIGSGSDTTIRFRSMNSKQTQMLEDGRTLFFSVLRGGVMVDVREHNAYNNGDADMPNRNNTVVGLFEEMVLKEGPTKIDWWPAANVSEVTIWPRWWTI